MLGVVPDVELGVVIVIVASVEPDVIVSAMPSAVVGAIDNILIVYNLKISTIQLSHLACPKYAKQNSTTQWY